MAGASDRRGRPPVDNRRYDRLSQLSPSAFEQLIADHYRKLGYSVERVGHGGAHFDGGIDLKLRRGGEFVVVQCKRENALKLTHNVGHELLGIMCTQGATAAVVVNSGEFTRYARESAQGDPRLTLVDGDELRRWFPNLAVPADAAAEAVPAERIAKPLRERKRNSDASGLQKLAWPAAVLAALMLWQCNRSAPAPVEQAVRTPVVRSEPRPTPMAAEPRTQRITYETPPAGAESPSSGVIEFSRTSEAERADWERRNAESMRILEASTPEL